MKKATLTVDPGKVLGKIKPMHAVNNYPVMGDAYAEEFRALKVPFARLHDTAFINPHLVDIPAVFPDFSADENDPASYDFTFTDFFLSRLVEMGCEPFYRLGVSIENYRAIKPYGIVPPSDFEKWARICEHVILHYNEGWANGFHFGIRYWEIWNEPENYPEQKDNQMWTGTFEEYIKLYKITANHLKNKFPDLKIGGYASCGFYQITGGIASEDAKTSDRTDYFVTCFHEFLDAIREEGDTAPLDFFSWHSYGTVSDNIAFARYARAELDAAGFGATESILNEWNPDIKVRGESVDAANILSNMIALEGEPLDLLMYYDFRADTSYCGVFDPVHTTVFPAYYAFDFFGKLYRLENEIACSLTEGSGLFACAAKGEKGGTVAIANPTAEPVKLSLSGIAPCEVLTVDGKHPSPAPVKAAKTVTVAPASILLVKFA